MEGRQETSRNNKTAKRRTSFEAIKTFLAGSRRRRHRPRAPKPQLSRDRWTGGGRRSAGPSTVKLKQASKTPLLTSPSLLPFSFFLYFFAPEPDDSKERDRRRKVCSVGKSPNGRKFSILRFRRLST